MAGHHPAARDLLLIEMLSRGIQPSERGGLFCGNSEGNGEVRVGKSELGLELRL